MGEQRKIIPVIISGGGGTRLWPMTRDNLPKQFLPFFDRYSLFQNTVERAALCSDCDPKDIITITSDQYLKQTYDQLNEFEPAAKEHVIGEPSTRDTTTAIAYAAFYCAKHFNPDDILWILPADHHIEKNRALKIALSQAKKAAEDGYICTFGIKTTRPDTAFGYIKKSNNDLSHDDYALIDSFHEKPNQSKAELYQNDPHMFWNSGMFVGSISTLLSEIERLCPEIYSIFTQHVANKKASYKLSPEIYNTIPKESFDIGIMEKTDKAAVVPCDIGWSDVGTWNALWQMSNKDKNGNVLDGHIAAVETQDCLVHAKNTLVAAVGLKDLVIIEEGDSILIADKQESTSIKKVVAALQKNNAKEVRISPFEKTVWGQMRTLSESKQHIIKETIIEPESRTSLHMHHHRNEYWSIVEGQAEVEIGDNTHQLEANDTISVPAGTMHRIKNIGQSPLKIIEMHTGSYLGEDDIVRIADSYGRSAA